jgi:predicted ATPase
LAANFRRLKSTHGATLNPFDKLAPDSDGLAIGACRLFPQLRLLLRDGARVEIGTKAFDVLMVLAEARGQAVSKDDLISRVWPDQIIEENSLQAQISAVRRAMGADRHLVTTEFGRGYRLTLGPGDGAKRPARPGEPSAFDFPLSLSPLVGRKAELGELEDIIAPGSLVTITGTGGIGKSRLAMELGTRLGAKFPDGTCLVELASLTDADLVFATIASKLHLEATTIDLLAVNSRTSLRRLTILLILDSCEQVLDRVAPVVRELLKAAPGLAILTTSQEPIGIVGEHVYRLQPLGLPPHGVRSLKELAAFPSAELLMNRVREANRTYRLDDAHVSDICNICSQLDGIPLAIELAAARIPLLGISTVVKGLSDRFKLLAGGRRTAVPRHQTLRATLEWSFMLLGEDERTLFMRLGLFAGAFTLSAVGFVALPQCDQDWTVNDLMASLVVKSLLSVESNVTSARFRLFESTRAFALEKLASTGEFEELSNRHAAFFRSRLTSATRDWKSLPSNEWVAEYQDDLNDVRFAIDWISSDGTDSRTAAELLCASLPFWMQLSLLDECQSRVSAALEHLEATGALDPSLEIQLTAALGASSAWVDGPTPKAERAWSRTLQLAQMTADVDRRLDAHYGLWLYHLRVGNYERSLEHASDLRLQGFRNGDVQAELAGQRACGVSHHFLGQHGAAESEMVDMLRKTETGYRSFPFRFGVDQRSAALAFLARVVWVRGDTDRSFSLAARGVAEARVLHHASSLCCALLEGACTVAALDGNLEMLESSAEEAVRVAEQYNLGFWRAYARSFAALNSVLSERSAVSVEQLRSSLNVLRSIHLDQAYSVFEVPLAEGLAGLCQHEEARTVIDNLIGPLSSSPDHWGLPYFLKARAAISGIPDEQVRDRLAAQGLARRQGANRWL